MAEATFEPGVATSFSLQNIFTPPEAPR